MHVYRRYNKEYWMKREFFNRKSIGARTGKTSWWILGGRPIAICLLAFYLYLDGQNSPILTIVLRFSTAISFGIMGVYEFYKFYQVKKTPYFNTVILMRGIFMSLVCMLLLFNQLI